MNIVAKSPVRDGILVEKTTPIKQLSRRDRICGGNIAYLTARFVAGASVFYQYIIPNGIKNNYELRIINNISTHRRCNITQPKATPWGTIRKLTN